MKRTLAALGLTMLLAPSPGHATTVAVDVAAFQYVPSGWVTAQPLDQAGSQSMRTPSGVNDAPTVARGDTLAFTNRDPLPHNVTKLGGPTCPASYTAAECTWAPVTLPGIGSGSLTIPSRVIRPFPLGTYVYKCTIHNGMRGQFIVA